jgi:hypothetical protein
MNAKVLVPMVTTAVGVWATYYFRLKGSVISTSLRTDLVAEQNGLVWRMESQDQRPLTALDIPGVSLSLKYSDQEVPVVRRSYCAVWHYSGPHVRGPRRIAKDPLRLEFPRGTTIHRARVLTRSRAAVDPRCRVQPTAVYLSFDFLDRNDGFVVEVIHSGLDFPVVAGSVMGVKLRRRGNLPERPERVRQPTKSQRLRRLLLGRFPIGLRTLIQRVLGTGLVAAFAVISIALVYTGVHNHQRLVAVSKYDLSTTAGQVKFANAVGAAKDISDESDDNYLPALLFALAAVGGIFFMLGDPFPYQLQQTVAGGRSNQGPITNPDSPVKDSSRKP